MQIIKFDKDFVESMFGAFEMLLIGTFCFITIATAQDIRKREVSDFLSYSFIITSLLLRIIWFILDRDLNIIILVLPSAMVFFIFSYILYRTGQWGGGDVKIAVGISIALASDISSLTAFITNLILFGAIYGLAYTFSIGLRHWRRFIDKISFPWAVFSIICVCLAAYAYLTLPAMLSLGAAFLLITLASIKYVEVIEKNCFVKAIPVERLVEGDWLVDDIDEIKNRGIGLTKSDIEKIKSKGLKKVMIKEGVPFVPAFLLAFLGTVIWGNVFLNIVFVYQYLAGLSLMS